MDFLVLIVGMNGKEILQITTKQVSPSSIGNINLYKKWHCWQLFHKLQLSKNWKSRINAAKSWKKLLLTSILPSTQPNYLLCKLIYLLGNKIVSCLDKRKKWMDLTLIRGCFSNVCCPACELWLFPCFQLSRKLPYPLFLTFF